MRKLITFAAPIPYAPSRRKQTRAKSGERDGAERPVFYQIECTIIHSVFTMRHAHASHALDRGAPIHLVQATLGHSSVATTGKYLHARPTESSSKYLAV